MLPFLFLSDILTFISEINKIIAVNFKRDMKILMYKFAVATNRNNMTLLELI